VRAIIYKRKGIYRYCRHNRQRSLFFPSSNRILSPNVKDVCTMTDWRNLSQKANKLTLESAGGYLVCVEGGKTNRVSATRSRPGPWEILEMIANPGQASKQNKQRIEAGTEVALKTFHGTYLQVSKKSNKEGIPPGMLIAGKDGGWFTVCVMGGKLALKNAKGHFIRVLNGGKMMCNSPEVSKGCKFRFFPRKSEYDDPRYYYDCDGSGKEAIIKFERSVIDLCGRFLLSLPSEQLQSVDRLFIQIEQMWWFYEDQLADNDDMLPHMSQEEFGRQVFRLCSLLQGSYHQYAELCKIFSQYMSKVPVFGAILLNKKLDKCLMVRSYRGKTWMFPRGKVNEGEGHATAACREVLEEVGYDCKALLNTENYIAYKENKLKQVKLYIVSGVAEEFNFQTQTKKEIGKIAWRALKDLPSDKDAPGAGKYKSIMKAIKSLKAWVANAKKQKKLELKKEKQKERASKAAEKKARREEQKAAAALKSGKGKRTASDFNFDRAKVMAAYDRAFQG
jgi:8-oxo-dGTP pyrophosphatase MutT (NUDIX family)